MDITDIIRNMTKEQAINIVKWRTKGDYENDDCGLTWRGISYTFINHYPDEAKRWNIQHTQPCGMILCETAFRILGIEIE
jgi:hypothetical protein